MEIRRNGVMIIRWKVSGVIRAPDQYRNGVPILLLSSQDSRFFKRQGSRIAIVTSWGRGRVNLWRMKIGIWIQISVLPNSGQRRTQSVKTTYFGLFPLFSTSFPSFPPLPTSPSLPSLSLALILDLARLSSSSQIRSRLTFFRSKESQALGL